MSSLLPRCISSSHLFHNNSSIFPPRTLHLRHRRLRHSYPPPSICLTLLSFLISLHSLCFSITILKDSFCVFYLRVSPVLPSCRRTTRNVRRWQLNWYDHQPWQHRRCFLIAEKKKLLLRIRVVAPKAERKTCPLVVN